MPLRKFVKDPNAKLDYTIDWSEWLPAGDTIVSMTPSATTGITIASSSRTSTSSTVWLSGGAAGMSYDVTMHIVTSGGREDDRTITIVCKEL